jgi:hypothetical protein
VRRRTLTWEPLVLLALAVLVPLLAAAGTAWELRSGRLPASETGATTGAHSPYDSLLTSPREDRAFSPTRWLEIAADSPASFRRAVTFCERREYAPLPNCRNLLTAHRACLALDTLTAGGLHAR